MPITVTNSHAKSVRSAGIDFKPGKTDFPENQLTQSQLAQINAAPTLSVKQVEAVPAKESK
ncbi:hypothetical protein J5X92_01700 [Alteromonas sp. K632G]|jgi:hypothetical protein|uniref:HI1506-related protein n=1 Tax=Alteromonas sp. K632G TaxID=2820757 RepID=UPI001AD607B3|nr:HI1506-related protein [Alteromonas sp. K632G]MBO7920930.1 hypothetical protein [Alteromonas sp. K632G]